MGGAGTCVSTDDPDPGAGSVRSAPIGVACPSSLARERPPAAILHHMSDDPLVPLIVQELVARHGARTVLLYGLRAKGTARPDSDYDVLAVRGGGDKGRDA